MSFTARVAIAFAAGIAGAAILAPIAAAAVYHAGWRFPFPRIFDRTVMVTLFAAIGFAARGMRLGPLLTRGFKRPRENLNRALRGLAAAVAIIAVLMALAIAAGGRLGFGAITVSSGVKYLAGAIVIGILEEGFFRAFLLGGMRDDFGRTGALIVSAVIYALAHLVRSPARFVATGYEPMAGVATLAGSFAQFRDPAAALPELAGLFILGIVLGAAFLQTGTVYFSIGLHGGLVLGVKLWPKLIRHRRAIPVWFVGAGRVPLIGGAGAWAAALIVLAMLPRLTGTGGEAG
ncbi:MAG: lysostaphin resistance A-like protein [Candidatus Binataceae bacterium]